MEKKDEEINLDTKNLKRIVINSINNIIKKSMEGGDYSTDKESILTAINVAIQCPKFYEIEFNILKEIINESIKSINNSDPEETSPTRKSLAIFIQKAYENYPDEALELFKTLDFTFETADEFEIVMDILSCIREFPLCVKLNKYLKENKALPKNDEITALKNENERLKEENEELKNENKRLKASYDDVTDHDLATRDYDGDLKLANKTIKEKIKEIQILKDEIESYKKDSGFKKKPVKPDVFEENIHKAATEGNLESVKYLIEAEEGFLETYNEEGCTPLQVAAWNGRLNVVEYLIRVHHQNVELKDKYGRTPLHLACWSGQKKVVEYLVSDECNADVNANNGLGWKPIHFAACKNKLDIVKFLIEKCRVKPEDEVIGGYNALFIAARSGSYDVVVYLVSEKRMVVTPKMRKHAKDDRVKDYLSRW